MVAYTSHYYNPDDMLNPVKQELNV